MNLKENTEKKSQWSTPVLEELNFSDTQSGAVFDTIESLTTGVGPVSHS